MKRSDRAAAHPLERAAWSSTARQIFTEVARSLVANGFDYREIVAILEDALLAAAAQEGVAPGRVGVPAAARRRAEAGDAEEAEPLPYAVATRLIGRWLVEPGFQDEKGPVDLPLHGSGSFDTLAQMAGVDPESALRELTRVGAVEKRAGRVRLHAPAYVPARGVTEKIDIAGRDAAEFLRVMFHNVYATPEGARLQRKASYDNIGRSAVKKLEMLLKEEAERALHAANRSLAQADRDRNPAAPGGERTRVSFGVYINAEPVKAEKAAVPRKEGRRR